MRMTVKLPRAIFGRPGALTRAIENGLEGAAKAVKVDFGVTTQTFKHRPTFTIEREPGLRRVGTDDEIYGYLDEGTPRHDIPPKPGGVLVFGTPYGAKTSPGVIGSGPGSRGNTMVYTRKVIDHPGTKARNFAQTIADKWEKQLPIILQRALDSEL